MWAVFRHATAAAMRTGRAFAVNRPAGGVHARVPIEQLRAAALARSGGQTGVRTFVLSSRRLAAAAGAAKTTRARSPARASSARTTKRKPASSRARKTKAKTAASKKKKTPGPRGRPKKVLTPEEAARVEVRDLKKVALLKEPAKLPDRTWMVYATQHLKGIKGQGDLGGEMKRLSASYKTLSSSELEGLKATAEQNRLANDASHRSWVESYTPEEIAAANRARSRLKRVFKVSNRGPIHDDRQPKRAVSSYILFTKTRWQSGDFAGRMPGDAAKSISSEWKSLSEAEKKPYHDSAKADSARYEQELKSVLGRTVRRKTAATA